MFSYFILRIEKQLFCYLYGGMLALFFSQEGDCSW